MSDKEKNEVETIAREPEININIDGDNNITFICRCKLFFKALFTKLIPKCFKTK